MIHKPEKALIKTNPHLRSPKARKAQFSAAVVTSTRIEGVTIDPAELRKPVKRTVKRK